jgi:hypothetical protein
VHLTWKKDWTRIVFLFIVLRLVYSALGFYLASGPPPERLAKEAIFTQAESLLKDDVFSQKFVNVWLRWDTGWYLKIAAFGYSPDDNSTVFMPLFPLLTRFLGGLLGGNYLLGALLVTNLCALAALILLYEIALQEGLAPESAHRTLLFYMSFPTAFFLLAAYTEAPFLAALLAAWLLARRGKWLAAGLLAGVATLVRMQGVVMTAVLGWAFLAECAGVSSAKPLEQVRQTWGLFSTRLGRRSLLGRLKHPDWLAALLPLAVFGGYNLWLEAAGMTSVTGALQTGWGNATVMPWTGVWMFLQRLFTTPRVFVDYLDGPLFLLALGLSVYGLFRLNPALSIYTWLTLAMILMGGSTPHLLDSFSRYFMGLFPLFLLLGQWRPPLARLAVWALSLCLQTFLLLAFLDWRWVA